VVVALLTKSPKMHYRNPPQELSKILPGKSSQTENKYKYTY